MKNNKKPSIVKGTLLVGFIGLLISSLKNSKDKQNKDS
jgi:hypothetical protein